MKIKRLASQLETSNFFYSGDRDRKKCNNTYQEANKKKAVRNTVVVYDENTYLGVGEKLIKFLLSDFKKVIGINIKENEHDQVIANEESLVKF